MKRWTVLLAAPLLAFSLFTGCSDGDDGSGGEFFVTLSSNPQNLDPQLAQDQSSVYVIRNIYGTLMDIDGSGMIVNGTAKSYTVSADGLKYTFTLRDGLCWYGLSSDEQIPLTAYDYEFAFRRIYDPDTHSPHTERFSNIKNSMAVYGGAKSAEELGVKAVDEATLEITLESPDCEFLKKLAHSAASPCNKELFLSTKGRYGLAADSTYACGAFYISDWNYDPYWHDNHITMEKISFNSADDYKTFPDIVNIEITDDRSAYETENNLLTDAYVIDDAAVYDRSMKKNYDCSEYVSSTACLFISPQSPIANDKKARKALFSSVDLQKAAEELRENSVIADGLIPSSVTVLNKSFRAFYGSGKREISSRTAKSDWESFIKLYPETDFNSSILLAYDKLDSQSLPYLASSCFEEQLELYCTVVFENSADFDKRIAQCDYDICIASICAGNNSAEDFLKNASEFFPQDKALEQLILKTERCVDISEKAEAVKACEEYIYENAYALPLSCEKKYFLTRNNVSGLWYDPFTEAVFFKYAKKD